MAALCLLAEVTQPSETNFSYARWTLRSCEEYFVNSVKMPGTCQIQGMVGTYCKKATNISSMRESALWSQAKVAQHKRNLEIHSSSVSQISSFFGAQRNSTHHVIADRPVSTVTNKNANDEESLTSGGVWSGGVQSELLSHVSHDDMLKAEILFLFKQRVQLDISAWDSDSSKWTMKQFVKRIKRKDICWNNYSCGYVTYRYAAM